MRARAVASSSAHVVGTWAPTELRASRLHHNPATFTSSGTAYTLPPVHATRNEGLDEVLAILVVEPAGVEVVERKQEPGFGEVGDECLVDQRHVGGTTFGDRSQQGVAKLGIVGYRNVDAVWRCGRLGDGLHQRFLGHGDAQLIACGSCRDPMRADETPLAPGADDDPFIGQLGEGTMDRRSADAVALAQLMLGGKAVAWARTSRRRCP